jgi:hypothetical protein
MLVEQCLVRSTFRVYYAAEKDYFFPQYVKKINSRGETYVRVSKITSQTSFKKKHPCMSCQRIVTKTIFSSHSITLA